MELPPELEICTRDRDGHPCKGLIFRPQANVIYCPSCGGNEPGVLYVPKAHADQLAAEVATLRAVTGYAVNTDSGPCHRCGTYVPALGGIRSNAATWCVACKRDIARVVIREDG